MRAKPQELISPFSIRKQPYQAARCLRWVGETMRRQQGFNHLNPDWIIPIYQRKNGKKRRLRHPIWQPFIRVNLIIERMAKRVNENDPNG